MDHILKYWDLQADKYKNSHIASWGDIYAINLEIENISQYIEKDQDILDAGCGNGYSTLKYVKNNIRSIIGIDLSSKMIEQANKNILDKPEYNKVEFKTGNIEELEFNDNSFDVVYTTRALINISSWEKQKKAILECIRVCKKKGKIIFSEAFLEPLNLLNSLRALSNIKPLKEPYFNKFLEFRKLNELLISLKIEYKVIDFSSIYYLGTRFLREIIEPKETGYENNINKIFYDIEKKYSGGKFGIQQAYIITKN